VNLGLEAITGLVVAILGGAAVGVERQQSGQASALETRLGGVPTFTLLGEVAGIAVTIGERRFAWQTGASLAAMAAAGTCGISPSLGPEPGALRPRRLISPPIQRHDRLAHLMLEPAGAGFTANKEMPR